MFSKKGHLLNKHKSQSGSAHLIIVVVLLFALVGGLGFVFWQNRANTQVNTSTTNNKKIDKIDNGLINTDTTEEPTATSIATELTKIVADANFKTGLSIKYPDGWVVTSKYDDSYPPYNWGLSTITSPDGKIAVIVEVGNRVGGGEGSPDQEQLMQFETKEIPNYPNGIFVTAVYCDVNSDVADKDHCRYSVGVRANIETNKSKKVGDLSNIFSSSFGDNVMNISSASNGDSLSDVRAMINIKFLPDGEVTNLNEISEAMSNDNYMIAKQIVQSLYVKE